MMHMGAAACGKSLVARQTFERFDLQVNSLVHQQVAVFGELPSTLCTPEGPVCFPTGQSVHREATPGCQRLATGCAGVGPPAGCLVRLQVAEGAKPLPTVGTPVESLPGMRSELVDVHAAFGSERLPTGGAGAGPLPTADTQFGPPGEAAAEATPTACLTCRTVGFTAHLLPTASISTCRDRDHQDDSSETP